MEDKHFVCIFIFPYVVLGQVKVVFVSVSNPFSLTTQMAPRPTMDEVQCVSWCVQYLRMPMVSGGQSMVVASLPRSCYRVKEDKHVVPKIPIRSMSSCVCCTPWCVCSSGGHLIFLVVKMTAHARWQISRGALMKHMCPKLTEQDLI